jgi:excisionase family DNA binding protein
MKQQRTQADSRKRRRRVKAAAPAQKDVLTPRQIARTTGIGLMSIYNFLESGALPGVRLGKRWYVSSICYQNWLAEFGRRPAA